MTYEAVSPAAPSHTTSEHYDTNIALHGLADISSNREKLPLQEKHVSHHSSQQQVPSLFALLLRKYPAKSCRIRELAW